jgi:hypothetical protein
MLLIFRDVVSDFFAQLFAARGDGEGMKARSVPLAFLLLASCGPAPEEHIDRLVLTDGPEPASCSGSWLARDEGSLVRFDGIAGEVLARAPAPELFDVTADDHRALALVPGDGGVHVVEHDLQLHDARLVARAMEGERLAPLHAGVVVFADGLWSYLDPDVGVVWERALPSPRSLWRQGDLLFAWTGELVAVARDGTEALPLDFPARARVAPFRGGIAAAWLEGDHLHLRAPGERPPVWVGAGEVLDLVALPDQRLALLLASPARVVVVDPDTMAAAGIKLAGAVLASPFFGRNLAHCEGLLLVGTTAGLERIEVGRGRGLHRAATFSGLGAPLAGPLP